MKTALIILLAAIAALILVEIGLRVLFGFGNPLLYMADPQMGYRIAPNQQVRRFGNRIQVNQYSMRGPDISAERPQSTLRILLLGDSIANGGWWTDQSNTLSEMMSRQLQADLATNDWSKDFQQVETLNASANSWGPRNELAYLLRFGHFEAQVIVLLLNTDDLFTIAPNSLEVGRDPNYPVRKPPFAIAEVLQRYVLQSKPSPELQTLRKQGGDRVGANIEAIRQIKKIADEAGTEFLLAMTPLLRETGEPGPRDYEVRARQQLKEFSQFEQISYLDFLPAFNAVGDPQTLFRDTIHLSPAGNQLVNEKLTEAIQALLSPTAKLPASRSQTGDQLQDVIEDPWS